MLYDRPYMQEGSRGRTSPLTWIICATVAGYLLEMALLRWFNAGSITESLGLTVSALKHGRVWTLITYGLLHPEQPVVIFCNMLGLYFLGRELVPLLGSRRFYALYASALVAGGLAWAAVNWRHAWMAPEPLLLGATAAVDAVLIVFACFFPNQEMTFLLAFVIPVRLKPKYIAGAFVLFDLFGFIFYEILGEPSPLGFAHSSHLGGMAAGWIYYRFFHDPQWRIFPSRAEVELPKWLKRQTKAEGAPVAASSKVNLVNRADLRAEVDRILDKINSHGFGALTNDEKRLLDEARDLLSKR